jgi:hypothetical protein
MRLLVILILTGLSLYYLNCDGSSSAAENNSLSSLLFPGGNQQNINTGNDIILSNGSDINEFKTDAVNIDTAYISGDSVSFTVNYGGGCREHIFSLAAVSYFSESNPVQAKVLLSHDSNNDACKALITKQGIKFNLLPLKKELKKYYHSESGTIILNVFTGSSPDKAVRLTYNFR